MAAPSGEDERPPVPAPSGGRGEHAPVVTAWRVWEAPSSCTGGVFAPPGSGAGPRWPSSTRQLRLAPTGTRRHRQRRLLFLFPGEIIESRKGGLWFRGGVADQGGVHLKPSCLALPGENFDYTAKQPPERRQSW